MAGRERIVDKVSCFVGVVLIAYFITETRKGGLVIYRDRRLAFHQCSLTYALTHGWVAPPNMAVVDLLEELEPCGRLIEAAGCRAQ